MLCGRKFVAPFLVVCCLIAVACLAGAALVDAFCEDQTGSFDACDACCNRMNLNALLLPWARQRRCACE